ncbi:MAG: nucleotidyltransferase family protein [Oscillospiraceae bacterium]|nr:nucleotidyltransferase family protein [Oscillospiraceae bacterium]
MKTIGIIAEYNPFHAGHDYHIRKSREAVGEDAAVIAVMSGDYVQRGEPALFSKFARAEAACWSGADLVVELPLSATLASAEGFAEGAAALLTAMGADYLSFGSETGDLQKLQALADLTRGPEFIDSVRAELKSHPEQSFAAARQRTAENMAGRPLPELRQPNNILGIAYLNAIRNTAIRPVAIRRIGARHDQTGPDSVPSAKELRLRFGSGESLEPFLPSSAFRVLNGQPTPDLCSYKLLLLDRLRQRERAAFPADNLGDRMYSGVRASGSLEEFQLRSASRRYPLSRVRRECLRTALNLRPGNPAFIRVLALNQRGRQLLRREPSVPFLVRPARVRALSAEAEAQFTAAADAHDLFCLMCGEETVGEDWRRSPAICL